jgi:hypothetical protein
MYERFKGLLLREWMQHKRGWALTLFALPVLFLLMLPWGNMHLGPVEQPLPIAVSAAVMTGLVMLATCLVVTGLQWSGLARRDVQDRSIEFWLSLPGTHTESLAATLLAHGVLLPMAALLASLGVGAVIAVAVLLKMLGFAGLAGLSVGAWLGMVLPMVLSFVIGVPLMMLWLAPFVLALMAASAWLKRWGLPALGVAVLGGGVYLEKVQGTRIVWDLLKAQFTGAAHALLGNSQKLEAGWKDFLLTGEPIPDFLSQVLKDLGSSFAGLASANLVGGLTVAAACFGLLILKRRRGG